MQLLDPAEPHVPPGHGRDGGGELDAVDPRGGIEDAVGARGRAAGVAEDRDAPRRVAEQRRHGEEHVPFVAGEDGVPPPLRVHRDALVEVEVAHRALLHDLDELVLGVLLVEEAGHRLHDPDRHREHAR